MPLQGHMPLENSSVSRPVEICLCHIRREVGAFWHRFPMLSWLQLLRILPFFDTLLEVHVDGGLQQCNRISPSPPHLENQTSLILGPWRLRTPESRHGKQRGRARGSLTPPWRLLSNIKAILSAQGTTRQPQEQLHK